MAAGVDCIYQRSSSSLRSVLVQLCFDFYMIESRPENLIGYRAYDSDALDEELRQDGIEMIALHRSNRVKSLTGPSQASALSKALAGRTLFRLDSVAPPPARPLGVLSAELPRFRATRLPAHPLQAILR